MSAEDRPSAQKYTAPAVDLACRILRHLAGSRHSHATLTEMAVALEANKTTCLRVLRVLERERFVQYDATTRRFSLGTYLFVLGNRAAMQHDLLSIALPYLAQAAAVTRLTCVLVQRDGADHYLYLAKEEPATPLRISVAVGQRFALASGSHGKCFLAWMDPHAVTTFLNAHGLTRFTKHSITEPAAYTAELRRVRGRGYAVSLEEHFPGVSGVAAPVFDVDGSVPLTVTAIGNAAELNATRAKVVGPMLKDIAAQISARIREGGRRSFDEVLGDGHRHFPLDKTAGRT